MRTIRQNPTATTATKKTTTTMTEKPRQPETILLLANLSLNQKTKLPETQMFRYKILFVELSKALLVRENKQKPIDPRYAPL